jgi:hypothetical protein
MDVFGIDRAVIVQPSVYGFDNRLLVEVVKSDNSRFRGVAVIDPHSSDEELAALHAAGIRGIRFNLLHPSGLQFDALVPWPIAFGLTVGTSRFLAGWPNCRNSKKLRRRSAFPSFSTTSGSSIQATG